MPPPWSPPIVVAVPVFAGPSYRPTQPGEPPRWMILIACRWESRPRLDGEELVVPRLGPRGRFAAAALLLAARHRLFRLRLRATPRTASTGARPGR